MTDASSRWARREDLALLTDFYELTMMHGYWRSGRQQMTASFEYFFRELPTHTGFAVAAGLEQLLDLVENLRFTDDDLAYLTSLGTFGEEFIDHLRGFKPTVSIDAAPEGTVVFPNEPILRVEGPLAEAQLLETAVLNALNYPTLIATKSARIRLAADGDRVMEFGLRRAQGPDGGLSGSRAAYIGGADATSNVLAGKLFGIPVAGTHAHSWVMSFDDEITAFRAYADIYPDNCLLLVDTYDTLTSGLPNALQVFKELRERRPGVRAAIRLDSGDLARLSKAAYALFTQAGFHEPLIVASNELDEDLIADLKRQGARINAWGVGTHLITSSSWPALGGVYKLSAAREDARGRAAPGDADEAGSGAFGEEAAGVGATAAESAAATAAGLAAGLTAGAPPEVGAWEPRIKLSSNPAKMTDPGRKRVIRYRDFRGRPIGDVLYCADEEPQSGPQISYVGRSDLSFQVALEGAVQAEDLLEPMMREGRRVAPAPSIAEVRSRAREQVASLPEELRRLRNPEIYHVGLSPKLAELKTDLIRHAPGVLH
ncbi:MAG: nicotinate phosphoribosyltransferase [Actinobacteria bacterium]|nr:nicotinate phosphoribosyltransferase [Actinomycetota bacterium]